MFGLNFRRQFDPPLAMLTQTMNKALDGVRFGPCAARFKRLLHGFEKSYFASSDHQFGLQVQAVQDQPGQRPAGQNHHRYQCTAERGAFVVHVGLKRGLQADFMFVQHINR